MQENPLVSVIIPTYNRAQVLIRSTQSVLDQTYQNFEIIVVDDASNDNTQEVVNSFSDPRIYFLRHVENKGPGAARNTGIKNSRGEFIAFLDSDDEWLPQKLEKQIKIFQKALPTTGMIGSNHYIINKNQKEIGITKTKSKKRLRPTLASWVLHKSVFEEIGFFDQRLFVNEDTDFFFRFLKKFSFQFIDEPLFNRYVSDDGISRDMNKIIEERNKYLEGLRSERQLYARHMNYLGKDLCLVGQIKKARFCFLKAFIAWPFNLGYLKNFLHIKHKWLYNNRITSTKDNRFLREI